MTSLILAVSVLAFGAIACDEGGEGGTPDAGDPTHNNQNGYCWSKPTDCYDMIPLEDGMHYHCCFDTTGYYCTSDEQLHLVDCEYTCTYDADEDAIYCAPDPENPNDEPEPIPSGQPF